MINNDDRAEQRLDALRQDLIEKVQEECPSFSDEIVAQVIFSALNSLKEAIESQPKLKHDFMTVEINRWDDQIFDPLYEIIDKTIKNVHPLAQKQLNEVKQRLSLLNTKGPVEADLSDSDSDGSWDLEPLSIKRGKNDRSNSF